MIDLKRSNTHKIMREYIEINIREIKKHLKKRKKIISNSNNLSITEEFREWNEEGASEKEFIWTLPDLTSSDRLKNFCRSIKKEMK